MSIIWIQKNRKFRKLLDQYRLTAKEYLRIEGEIIGDSGAFTFYRKNLRPPKIQQVIESYQKIDVDAGLHLDIPINFFKDRLNEKTKQKFLQRNIENAIKMRKLIDEQFKLIAVIQGITSSDYRDQLTQLIDLGFNRFAVGGLAFRSKSEINQILNSLSPFLKKNSQFIY